MINYGTDFVLKLYRKLEEGINPGREVPEFLCEHTQFRSVPAALGSLEYRRYADETIAAKPASAHSAAAVPNATAGWHYTVDQLGLFFEHALAIPQDDPRVRDLVPPNLWAPTDPVPQIIARAFGQLSRQHSRAGAPYFGDCTRRSVVVPIFPTSRRSPSPRSIGKACITACWAS